MKNWKEKKSGTGFVFSSLTNPPAWLMIQPQPAWVQHNNNKSLFWCTQQSGNGSGIHGKKKKIFFYDCMDSYSLYLNDKMCFSFQMWAAQESPQSCNSWFSWTASIIGQRENCFESHSFFSLHLFCIKKPEKYFLCFRFSFCLTPLHSKLPIMLTNLSGFLVKIISLKLIFRHVLCQKKTAKQWK